MNENVNKFIDSVQKQDYTAAKDEFQTAMAEKINSSFENKKIELASQMAGNSVVEEETTEHLDEKKTRQMMDPDKETMVVKDGKVEVIDKKDVKKYMKKGYELAEESKSVPDKHQEKIAKDTLKNPNKSLMGGPSAKEAEEILRNKFGYSTAQIKKLKEASRHSKD